MTRTPHPLSAVFPFDKVASQTENPIRERQLIGPSACALTNLKSVAFPLNQDICCLQP